MSELNIDGIEKKLTGMLRRIRRLAVYQSLTFAEYLEDEDKQAMIERYLEVVIQAAIDINRILIKHSENINPDKINNAELFRRIGQYQLLTPELAEQLAFSAGFRNVLAHVYDDVNPEIVYQALQLVVPQYSQYILQIQSYLESLEDDLE